jgi:hypothetical protein
MYIHEKVQTTGYTSFYSRYAPVLITRITMGGLPMPALRATRHVFLVKPLHHVLYVIYRIV